MPRAPAKSHKAAAAVPPTAPYPTANAGPASSTAAQTQSSLPSKQPIAISSLLNDPEPEGSSSTAAAPPSPQGASSITPTAATVNAPTTGKGRSKNDPLPWLDVQLPTLTGPDGETYIPIYDDCNEIRRKIRAFFSNSNTEYKCTQKRFLEVIGNVNSNSYRRFMAAKGEGGGAENGTYTGAYVFFEKRRVWEGKPKGKKRLDAEAMYPTGRDLIDSNRPVWVITRR